MKRATAPTNINTRRDILYWVVLTDYEERRSCHFRGPVGVVGCHEQRDDGHR